MEIKNVRKGMWVESQHGVGKVLVVTKCQTQCLWSS